MLIRRCRVRRSYFEARPHRSSSSSSRGSGCTRLVGFMGDIPLRFLHLESPTVLPFPENERPSARKTADGLLSSSLCSLRTTGTTTHLQPAGQDEDTVEAREKNFGQEQFRILTMLKNVPGNIDTFPQSCLYLLVLLL